MGTAAAAERLNAQAADIARTHQGHPDLTPLPPDILSAITTRVQSDWPSDPAMQQHLIARQASAYAQLVRTCDAMEKNEYSTQIIDFAFTSWPDDYEMALHTLKRQLASSKAFFEYTRPAVPAEVLQQLKEKTFEEAKEEIGDFLFRKKAHERFGKWMEELKQKSYISIR